MLRITALLYKVLAEPFYKVNSGFFLFVFLVLFGLVEPGQVVNFHASLMQVVASSVAGMLLAMGAWLLYGYKCSSFVLSSLEKPAHTFLISLQGWPVARQVLVFFFCQLILYLPVLVYAGFVISIGWRAGRGTGVAAILLFLVLLCLGSAYVYFRKLNSFHRAGFGWQLRLPFRTTFSRPPVLYLVYHVFYERKLAWAALKVFSSFIFYLVFVLHRADFSLGYFRLLFLIATIGHSMLVYYSFVFVEKQLAFSRSLPIRRTTRLLAYV